MHWNWAEEIICVLLPPSGVSSGPANPQGDLSQEKGHRHQHRPVKHESPMSLWAHPIDSRLTAKWMNPNRSRIEQPDGHRSRQETPLRHRWTSNVMYYMPNYSDQTDNRLQSRLHVTGENKLRI